MTYLYGMEYSNKDFTQKGSFGKNTFTNAFPLSVAQYISLEKGLEIPVIRAIIGADGLPRTEHVKTPWASIINTDPANARFSVESSFTGYQQYSHGVPNKSDVVIIDNLTGDHRRPLEIKLVVVPTSGSANKPRNQQTCEIVSRPSTVEQVVFSIANDFGPSRRYELQEILRNSLGVPNDYKWQDQTFMLGALPRIVKSVDAIIEAGIGIQTPLVLVAVWRSEGQVPVIEEDHAFDVFVWTELAFLQLYLDSVRAQYIEADGTLKAGHPATISRSARTLIWIVRALWDYTTQLTLNFTQVQRDTSYGVQTDKAAAFAGAKTSRHMMSPEFLFPRVAGSEIDYIFNPAGHDFLLPERRLDAALSLRFTLDKLRKTETN